MELSGTRRVPTLVAGEVSVGTGGERTEIASQSAVRTARDELDRFGKHGW
jgi:hypothetical protein